MADTKLKGGKLLLYGEKNGVMIPLCGSTTCSLTITAEVREATKAPQSVWASNYYGKLSYKISAEGICIINEAKFTHRDIMLLQIQRQPLRWVMENKLKRDEFFSGYVIIDQFEDTGDQTDMQRFNFSGTGDGDILYTNPYQTIVIGSGNTNGVIGDEGTLIGWEETGDLPPINRDC